MTDVLLVEVTDRVATVTLNRPEARNALDRDLRRSLRHRMADLDADDEIDAVVLTGADPAFCAGLDLKELAGGGDALQETGATGAVPATGRGPLPPMSKPVIGAVNGVAITGGFELALACDFLVASDRARFADTHARVGIMPGWGLTVLLPQAVGIRRARQLSFTGNFLDAGTALAWGLVNHVVAHDELVGFAQGLARDVASNDPVAVRRIRRTYAEGSLLAAGEAWALEGEVAAEWQAGGLDPEAIEQRRQAVVARGRTQLG
jgi:enoyl-CoA hydratase